MQQCKENCGEVSLELPSEPGSIWELNFVGSICAIAASVVLLAIAERSGMLDGRGQARLER